MSKAHKKSGLFGLGFLSLGIVYGDIGTSPLYTINGIFNNITGIALTPVNILGAISAIFWALIITVSLKYVMIVLRADNRGEGGILALLTLVSSITRSNSRSYGIFLALGMLGAALFLAESVITPAISVLGALEGLNYAPALQDIRFNVVSIAVLILLVLFYAQRSGTAKIGNYFSYIMVLWFVTLGFFGFLSIAKNPAILAALNPVVAIRFLCGDGKILFVALSGIVLAVTGVEALYADMGHLGRNPIRFAWTLLVFPALSLNYLGQGAELLLNPEEAIKNPFYHLFPEPYILPAVILATFATIIASQAVISGTFSMTRQAVQLGLLPRLNIIHKSPNVIGQIYIPLINWLLFFLVFMTTIIFQSSHNLASAYGISVTLTMIISSILMYQVVTKRWHWKKWIALPVISFFLLFDFSFALSCLSKLWHGGWFTLAIAAFVMIIVTTWRQGKAILVRVMRSEAFYLEPYIKNLMKRKKYPNVNRTAVYLVENPDSVPSAFVDNLKHNMVMHDRNIFLTVEFTTASTVPISHRLEMKEIIPGFWQVKVRYGFMEHPDIHPVLEIMKERGLDVDPTKTSYFMSHQTIVSTHIYGMAYWREQVFSWMYRNSNSIFEYFDIPPSQVVILGSRIQI
ncbi:MAG: KUP/HAK/KT family potassium transporter [Hydrotalea sp.]|nr:KUP/HAK/KT family potassium transporter [Hydrotalea sp.]